MENEQWLLLENPLPRDTLQLGTLVQDYKRPGQNFYLPEGKTEQTLMRYKNYNTILTLSSSYDRRGQIINMIPKHTGGENTVQLEASECCVYQLRKSWAWFEELGAIVGAREWLLKSSKERQDVYLLTGLRTIRDGSIRRSKTRSTEYPAELHSSAGITMGISGVWDLFRASRISRRPDYEVRFETHEEAIIAVSYRRINLKRFEQSYMATLQPERNWLRPWSKRPRGEQPTVRESIERNWRDLVSKRSSSPQNVLESFIVRQEPTSTPTRQEEPLHPLGSLKSTVQEMIIDSDGAQDVMQFKESGTVPAGDDKSTTENDNVLAAISRIFGFFPEENPLVLVELVNMLIDSPLSPVYKKAIEFVPKMEFEQKFDLLLGNFAKDLIRSSQPGPEKTLARFVRRHDYLIAWSITERIYTAKFVERLVARDHMDMRLLARLKRSYDSSDSERGAIYPSRDSIILLSPRHLAVVESISFNGTAFLQLQIALSKFIEAYELASLGNISTESSIATANAPSLVGLSTNTVGVPLGFALITGFAELFDHLPYMLDTHVIKPLDLTLMRFMSYLRLKCRPRVQPGYQRVEWTCECGTLLYGDFEIAEGESIDAITQYLNTSAPTSGGSNSTTSQGAPTLPDQAHVNPAGSVTRGSRDRGTASESYSTAQTLRSTGNHSPEQPEGKPRKFLELCVNYRKWEVRLGEIDITDIATDEELFRAISKKYDSVRRSRANTLYILEPADIHFVHFALEDRHLVSIVDKPDSWPTSQEVDRKSWVFKHPPKISAHIFLHHMRIRRSHSRKLWLLTLPVKLERRMDEEEADLPTGWGVHIIEGLNKPRVSWLFFILVAIVFTVSVFWSIWRQGGLGVGPLCFNVLALAGSFLTSKFYEQRDM